MMSNQIPYYIGLDMGTNSVGWAVTDENYKILRGKGKDMWGVRLFDEAQTAKKRRLARCARRRRQREVARIGVLKEFFADAINEVNPGFFMRLEESQYWLEDRSDDNQQKFALFNDEGYTDKEYYDQYPTIFHLRKELIESSEPHDVRLVYLALSNMFKHRGHFLNKSLNAGADENVTMKQAYGALVKVAQEYTIELPETIDIVEFEKILGNNEISRTAKNESVVTLLSLKSSNKAALQLVRLMCGLPATVQTIYGEELISEENKNKKLSYVSDSFEEQYNELESLIGSENTALIDVLKKIHDIGLLSRILAGEEYLSVARVKLYDKHHNDKEKLKQLFRENNMKKERHEMFRIMGKDNYSAYVGSVNYKGDKQHIKQRRIKVDRKDKNKTSREYFYSYVKKVLGVFPKDENKIPKDRLAAEIWMDIENETFMPKQLTAGNGCIPNQVHLRELSKILENASEYLSFLNDVDDSGYTVREKIEQLFTFQIPYYVGPLSKQNSNNAWAERKPGEEKGKILPWNFKEKINVKKAAADFPMRMVRCCTYLNNEKVLPKQSLIYEKFIALNALNNLRVNGEKPSVALKQELFEELFSEGEKVTYNKIKAALIARGLYGNNPEDTIGGIDTEFKISLSSLKKLREVLEKESKGIAVHITDADIAMMEDIVFWGTVYSQSKEIMEECIKEKYGTVLSDNQIKRFCGMKFNGWGRLSREFLEMGGKSTYDGEWRSLIQALWETNDNLEELLGKRYTYTKELEKRIEKSEKALSEWTIDDLDDFYLSPAVKRMVWQTKRIVDEIVTVQGYAPKKIFLETTRDDAQTKAKNKGNRKESRKAFLQKCYGKQADISAETAKLIANLSVKLEETPEEDFRNRKIFLYFMQLGRCMYTYEEIAFEKLCDENSLWDRDHIIPRSVRFDDSIHNNMVLSNKTYNSAIKADNYPIRFEERTKQKRFWKDLKTLGLITQTKYDRLVRTEPLGPEELEGFVSRQLVFTGQGTKVMMQILHQAFSKEDTKIIPVKAGVVSQFRHDFDIVKVRCVNNLHHAHDAYLNIVAGNIYDEKFSDKEIFNHRDRYHVGKIFFRDVKNANWVSENREAKILGTIAKVRRELACRHVLQTQRSFIQNGELHDLQPVKAEKTDYLSYYPLKRLSKNKNMISPLNKVKQYGAYQKASYAFYVLVQCTVKYEESKKIDGVVSYCKEVIEKDVRYLEAVPIILGISSENDSILVNYLEKKLESYYSDKIKSSKKINKKNQLIELKTTDLKIENISVRKYGIKQASCVKVDGYYYYLQGNSSKHLTLKGAVNILFDDVQLKYIKRIEKAVQNKCYNIRDKEGKLIITKKRNSCLYDDLTNEMFSDDIASKRLSNTWIKKLKDNREKFMELEEEEQCRVLLDILKLHNGEIDRANLTKINGGAQAGILTMNKKISQYKDVLLIEQSVTGLWSKTTDLLTV